MQSQDMSLSPQIRERANDLLTEILEGIPGSRIESVRLTTSPEPYEAVPGSVWLSYRIRAADRMDRIQSYWQALLVSGLFMDVGKARGLPMLRGHSFTIVWPNGAETYHGSSTVDGPVETPMGTARKASIEGLLRRSVQAAGATVAQLRFVEPLGRLAPEVVVSVADPKAFLERVGDRLYTINAPIDGHASDSAQPITEGSFIDIRDTAGRRVAVAAYSTRTGHGSSMVHPSLAEYTSGFYAFDDPSSAPSSR